MNSPLCFDSFVSPLTMYRAGLPTTDRQLVLPKCRPLARKRCATDCRERDSTVGRSLTTLYESEHTRGRRRSDPRRMSTPQVEALMGLKRARGDDRGGQQTQESEAT